MDNIVIFGAPGSGKGTYSAALVEKFGYYHISTGDVLRADKQVAEYHQSDDCNGHGCSSLSVKTSLFDVQS